MQPVISGVRSLQPDRLEPLARTNGDDLQTHVWWGITGAIGVIVGIGLLIAASSTSG